MKITCVNVWLGSCLISFVMFFVFLFLNMPYRLENPYIISDKLVSGICVIEYTIENKNYTCVRYPPPDFTGECKNALLVNKYHYGIGCRGGELPERYYTYKGLYIAFATTFWFCFLMFLYFSYTLHKIKQQINNDILPEYQLYDSP